MPGKSKWCAELELGSLHDFALSGPTESNSTNRPMADSIQAVESEVELIALSQAAKCEILRRKRHLPGPVSSSELA